MATFPAIVADHPITEETKVREQRSGLGDGAEYITRFGLNPVDTTWRVKWSRLSDSERSTIESFLAARAADGEPFDWTPPDAAIAQRFRVEQWEPARTTPTGWALDLMFKRVYEVGGPILAPSKVTCVADAAVSDFPVPPTPCSTASTARGGSMWTQRVFGNDDYPNDSFTEQGSFTMSPSGDRYYIVFGSYLNTSMSNGLFYVISCVLSDGAVLWVRRLTPNISNASNLGAFFLTATNDGVVVVGRSTLPNRVFQLSKTDGAILWQKSVSKPDVIWGTRFAPISNTVFIIGSSSDPTFVQLRVSDGQLVRAKILTIPGVLKGFNGTQTYDLAERADGGFLLFGHSLGGGGPAEFMWAGLFSQDLSAYTVLKRYLDNAGFHRGIQLSDGFLLATQKNAIYKLGPTLDLVWKSSGSIYSTLNSPLGLEVDSAGVIYYASGVLLIAPAITGITNSGSNGQVVTISSDGSTCLSASASLSQIGVSGAYTPRDNPGSKSFDIKNNRFATLSMAYPPTIISHSISFPTTEKQLASPGGRTAAYVGDCSPGQPTLGGSFTIEDVTWTFSNLAVTVADISFTALDVTGDRILLTGYDWEFASRTL